MSYHEYMISREVGRLDFPFYALIFAALRQADTANASKIRAAWPDVAMEFEARYHAPGGLLDGEQS